MLRMAKENGNADGLETAGDMVTEKQRAALMAANLSRKRPRDQNSSMFSSDEEEDINVCGIGRPGNAGSSIFNGFKNVKQEVKFELQQMNRTPIIGKVKKEKIAFRDLDEEKKKLQLELLKLQCYEKATLNGFSLNN